jgi:hypothetical protein
MNWKPVFTVLGAIAIIAGVKAGLMRMEKNRGVDEAIALSRNLAARGDIRGAQRVLMDEANKIIRGRLEYQEQYSAPIPIRPTAPSIPGSEIPRLAAQTRS